MKSNQEQKVKVKRMNLDHQSVDKKEEKDLYCIPKTLTQCFFWSHPRTLQWSCDPVLSPKKQNLEISSL